jgi:hypothetical protein
MVRLWPVERGSQFLKKIEEAEAERRALIAEGRIRLISDEKLPRLSPDLLAELERLANKASQ